MHLYHQIVAVLVIILSPSIFFFLGFPKIILPLRNYYTQEDDIH